MALGEPFAESLAIFLGKFFAQISDRFFECTAFAIFLVGPTIAQKPTPLIDMKQRSPKLWTAQAFGETFAPHLVRINVHEFAALLFVLWEKSETDQCRHQPQGPRLNCVKRSRHARIPASSHHMAREGG